MLLKIPFHEKEEAKLIAKRHKVQLYFNNDGSKLWTLQGDVPEQLKKYIVGHSIENIYNYVLDVPYEDRAIAGMWKYHGLYKTSIAQTQYPQQLPASYRAQPYSYEAWVEKFINNSTVSPDISHQLKNVDTMTARNYQQEAKTLASKALQNGYKGFLVADDVGLGKTITAAIFAQKKEFKTVLVVTTLSATAHWRKTFLKFNFSGKDILIINYDRLQKLFKPVEEIKKTRTSKTLSKKKKNKQITKNFLAPIFDLVIWDEAQKLKNPSSNRAKMSLKIQLNATFNLYLSATPGQNPLELSYLAPSLALMTNTKFKSMQDFEPWCESLGLGVEKTKYGNFKWNKSAQSVEKMHQLLFKSAVPIAVRRVPEDIVGWPAINRILMPYDMNAQQLKDYNLSWNEFCESYEKIDKKSAAQRQAQYLRFRQKSSHLKIPHVYEHALELYEAGHSVAISVAFKDTLFDLKEQFENSGIKVSIIYGGQNSQQKEAQRVLFQEDKNHIVIFTVEEAISLHQLEYPSGIRPRSMIIHDMRWSAISMAQIEGRTHRDGKFSQIYWGFFDTTVDTQIAQIVLSKLLSMKTMIGDDKDTLLQIEALLDNFTKAK